jgi:hypothetical protein
VFVAALSAEQRDELRSLLVAVAQEEPSLINKLRAETPSSLKPGASGDLVRTSCCDDAVNAIKPFHERSAVLTVLRRSPRHVRDALAAVIRSARRASGHSIDDLLHRLRRKLGGNEPVALAGKSAP